LSFKTAFQSWRSRIRAGISIVKMKLTIIIPTFNSIRTLRRCLDSIAKQSFTDFEVILQDGGSSDGTHDETGEFSLAHPDVAIRMIVEKDDGIYDAMNRAMRRAKGQWLYFLGSDDELHDEHVLERIFTSLMDEPCDMIYGNAVLFGFEGWKPDGTIYDGAFHLQKLMDANICHQSIFYKTHFVRNRVGEYNTRYRTHADWDFNLRCWTSTKPKYMEILVAKFYGGGASSVKSDTEFEPDFLKNIMFYFSLSSFDPMINRSSFRYYGKVLAQQRIENRLRFLCDAISKRVSCRVQRYSHWLRQTFRDAG